MDCGAVDGARKLASLWMNGEVGFFMREELEKLSVMP
jgi:hypothetical protein